MRGALASVPGVVKINIKVGDNDFTVDYDSTKIKPEAMVSALVAKGEKGAKVKS